MDVQNITLDLSKTIMVGQIVRMGQGDSGGTTIRATILDNTAVPSLSGMTAEFCMRLPDGVHYVRDSNCTVSGNVITYVVDEEHCCSVSGYTDEAYFNVKSGSTTYSTTRFRVKVEGAAHRGAVPSESWDSEVEELINRGNEKLDEIDESLITQVSATIDDNVGTPNVSVSLSQRTPSALGKLLSLAFHNLNGNTGATGPQGPKGDKGDTVSVEPITNSEIDTVVSDGQLTSLHALDGTGLTYFWSKLTQKFASLVNLANIESSIAYVESTTAKTNHAVGDYFMLGSVLMRATAAIATGETINASKATPATVQGQIDTLRDSVSPSSVVIDLWGLTVVSFTESGNTGLIARVPIPCGFVPTRVSVPSTTFIAMAISSGGISEEVYFTNINMVRIDKSSVGLQLFVSRNLTDGKLYRFNMAVPKITLSR